VIAQHVRVAVPGGLFVFAVHLTDRRVEIDNKRLADGAITVNGNTVWVTPARNTLA